MAKKVAATFALGEIPHKQCLVYVLSHTTGVVWHQRVLILPISRPDDGRWVAVRPDLYFEILDLKDAEVVKAFVPLSRGGEIPQLGPMSTFSGPVDASIVDEWVPRARPIADALHVGQDDDSPHPVTLPPA